MMSGSQTQRAVAKPRLWAHCVRIEAGVPAPVFSPVPVADGNRRPPSILTTPGCASCSCPASGALVLRLGCCGHLRFRGKPAAQVVVVFCLILGYSLGCGAHRLALVV